ncbi:MAG: AVAST type 1 anti-phage system protein Avs1c [Rhodoferax sp.]
MNPRLKTMDTPKTREEFELRFHLLREAFRSDKMRIPPSMGESLLRLRHLPNGRLDFLSVDETARLQANMMLQFANFKLGPQEDEEQDPVVDA